MASLESFYEDLDKEIALQKKTQKNNSNQLAVENNNPENNVSMSELSAVDTAARSTTSQTFVVGSNTAQVTITPRSSSSRFIIYCIGVISTDDGQDGTFTTIYRDSTNLGQSATGLAFGNSVPTVSATYHPFSMTILDSPSTASSITYGLRFRSYNFDSDASTTSRLGNHLGGTSNAVPTHITVMELAG